MRILLSADGSDFSRAAAEKCREIIAVPEKTSVKIISFFEIVEPIDVSISPEFSREIEENAKCKAEEIAAQAASLIRERHPQVNVETEISLGAPDEVLIETAKEWRADLIVIGSHSRGFWERMLVGSISESLVHGAPCSILVVKKPNYEETT